MATEPAQAVPPSTTAAEPTAADLLPGRTAGSEDQPAIISSAGEHPTQVVLQHSDAGDAASLDTDTVLAGLKDANDVLRLSSFLPEAKTPYTPGPIPGEGATESGEQPGEQPGAKRPERIRIGALPEERQLAILALSDPNKTMEEILRGFAPNPATGTTPTPPSAVPGETPDAATRPLDPVTAADLIPPKRTVADVRGDLLTLRTQKADANRALDYEEVAKIDERMDTLRDELPEVQRAERVYGQAHQRAFAASVRTAGELYPQMNEDHHPLGREMIRLDQQWKASGDPLYHHHSKPVILATQAALNVGITQQARSSTPPVPTARPVPVSAPSPRAAVPGSHPPSPAAGGARTAYVADPNPAEADKLLDGVKSQEDVMALTRLVCGR